ncbi:unnamed protein product [Arctogadus glacialis]
MSEGHVRRRTAGGMGAVTRIHGALCGSPCDVTLRLKSLAAGRVVIGVGSQLCGAFRPLSLRPLDGRQAVSTGSEFSLMTPAPCPGRHVSHVEAPRLTAAASRLWSGIAAAVTPECHRGQWQTAVVGYKGQGTLWGEQSLPDPDQHLHSRTAKRENGVQHPTADCTFLPSLKKDNLPQICDQC